LTTTGGNQKGCRADGRDAQ